MLTQSTEYVYINVCVCAQQAGDDQEFYLTIELSTDGYDVIMFCSVVGVRARTTIGYEVICWCPFSYLFIVFANLLFIHSHVRVYSSYMHCCHCRCCCCWSFFSRYFFLCFISFRFFFISHSDCHCLHTYTCWYVTMIIIVIVIILFLVKHCKWDTISACGLVWKRNKHDGNMGMSIPSQNVCVCIGFAVGTEVNYKRNICIHT